MRKDKVKIIVFVPETHTDIIREVIGRAGGGKIGKYTFCSFSVKGVGRFKPGKGAKPSLGRINKLESVAEERIEFVCDRRLVKKILAEIKNKHPYEEVAYDIYPLLN